MIRDQNKCFELGIIYNQSCILLVTVPLLLKQKRVTVNY